MWALYCKELLELSRDKRVLVAMILVPLLVIPVFMAVGIGASAFVAANQSTADVRFDIRGDLGGYGLISALNQNQVLERESLPPNMTPEQAILSERVDFVLKVEGEMPDAKWQLYYNDADMFSNVAVLAESLKKELIRQWQQQQLANFGLTAMDTEKWLDPVELEMNSVASQRETLGAMLGGLLPYLMLIVALSGALYPAIDIGAGEKERGTLETLLMVPLAIEKLVMAKVALVSTCAFFAGALMLFSLGFWAYISAYSLNLQPVVEILETFSFGDLVLVLILTLPVCVIFGAMMTAISFYSRSFKEAQNYMSLGYMIPILPLMLVSMPGIELSWAWTMVPLSNVALAIKELAKGTLDYSYLILIWLNAGVVGWALTALTTRWVKKESVLFR